MWRGRGAQASPVPPGTPAAGRLEKESPLGHDAEAIFGERWWGTPSPSGSGRRSPSPSSLASGASGAPARAPGGGAGSVGAYERQTPPGRGAGSAGRSRLLRRGGGGDGGGHEGALEARRLVLNEDEGEGPSDECQTLPNGNDEQQPLPDGLGDTRREQEGQAEQPQKCQEQEAEQLAEAGLNPFEAPRQADTNAFAQEETWPEVSAQQERQEQADTRPEGRGASQPALQWEWERPGERPEERQAVEAEAAPEPEPGLNPFEAQQYVTNPFEGVAANPFEDVAANPFEGVAANPFEGDAANPFEGDAAGARWLSPAGKAPEEAPGAALSPCGSAGSAGEDLAAALERCTALEVESRGIALELQVANERLEAAHATEAALRSQLTVAEERLTAIAIGSGLNRRALKGTPLGVVQDPGTGHVDMGNPPEVALHFPVGDTVDVAARTGPRDEEPEGSPIRKLNRKLKISDWKIKTFHV